MRRIERPGLAAAAGTLTAKAIAASACRRHRAKAWVRKLPQPPGLASGGACRAGSSTGQACKDSREIKAGHPRRVPGAVAGPKVGEPASDLRRARAQALQLVLGLLRRRHRSRLQR